LGHSRLLGPPACFFWLYGMSLQLWYVCFAVARGVSILLPLQWETFQSRELGYLISSEFPILLKLSFDESELGVSRFHETKFFLLYYIMFEKNSAQAGSWAARETKVCGSVSSAAFWLGMLMSSLFV
jgi:hypothetical protein